MNGGHRFGVFAKYWSAGQVKTRLGQVIGHESAAAVYHVFLETLVWRFRDRDQSELVFTPADRLGEFEALKDRVAPGSAWRLQTQGDGDLGQRMARYFARAFSAGLQKAVLIGSDSPTIPDTYLYQAYWLLNGHPVVLGPSVDGGYYLVAAKESVPPIFDEIPWSSDDVLFQTIDRLQDSRIPFALLPTWYDVDSVEDLERLQMELQMIVEPANFEAERNCVNRPSHAELGNMKGANRAAITHPWQSADLAWARNLKRKLDKIMEEK